MNRAQRRLAEKQKKKETISAQTRATNDRLHSYYQKSVNPQLILSNTSQQ